MKTSFSPDPQTFYGAIAKRSHEFRKFLGRPLTYTEKVLAAHLAGMPTSEPIAGQTDVTLNPVRVAMQDATAQMALLQFLQADLGQVVVPSTVHCDHLIQARHSALLDLNGSLKENSEVFDFLQNACSKLGIGFWKPGSGIIHQVVLEQYAFPGGLMIGTDSHTPNAGGLGMLAIGAGGAEAVEVMSGQPWALRWPRLIGVRLTGKLNGWTAPKDIILKVAGILGVEGGTGAIIEYFGPGAEQISCTGKATIANMGAELGATTSVFPFDDSMVRYLQATDRSGVAALALAHAADLRCDPEVESDPGRYFSRVIEINLDTLEPHVVGPHTPDLARPVSEVAADVAAAGYPAALHYCLLGSCTNSSYEDLTRAANIARQAASRGLKARTGFLISPGSQQIRDTAERDGLLEPLQAIGGVILANACGPCIGQWKRDDIKDGERNSILTSFNRNFEKRNDGNAATHAFIASPEVVTAFALFGTLDCNPLVDSLQLPDGNSFKLQPPLGEELPSRGFVTNWTNYVAPTGDQASLTVRPDSTRIQLLAPFPSWHGSDFNDLPVLLKAGGKCTTDHISPAGKWLAYRGHLDRISDNMFIAAFNNMTQKAGTALDVTDGEVRPIAQVARRYREAGKPWAVLAELNYGEGSSREHAAMSPRYFGCKVVIAKTFARIHESNLKKQGILPLFFKHHADYDLVGPRDTISVENIAGAMTGQPVRVRVRFAAGGEQLIEVTHTMSQEQWNWFKAGSILNYVKVNAHREKTKVELEPARPTPRPARKSWLERLWQFICSWWN